MAGRACGHDARVGLEQDLAGELTETCGKQDERAGAIVGGRISGLCGSVALRHPILEWADSHSLGNKPRSVQGVRCGEEARLKFQSPALSVRELMIAHVTVRCALPSTVLPNPRLVVS